MSSAQLQVHPSALRKPRANGRSCFFGQGDEGPVATSVTRRPTFVTRPPGWRRAAGRGERSPSTSPRTAIVTRVTLDLAGNPTEVRDDKGLNATTPYVLQTQAFNLVGRPLRTLTSDAGDTLVLLDLVGQPIALFKSGDLGIAYAYDALRRRTTTTVLEGTSGASLADVLASGTVREVMQYGEASSSTPKVDNLLGKPWRAWDTAGRVESTAPPSTGSGAAPGPPTRGSRAR